MSDNDIHVPENFWADLDTLATDEPVIEGERPLSYLDVDERGVIGPVRTKVPYTKQILRLLKFEGEDGIFRDSHGGLIDVIAERLDLSRERTFNLLKRMRDQGLIEVSEAGIDRVYTVRVPRPKVKEILARSEQAKYDTKPNEPPHEDLISRFDITDKATGKSPEVEPDRLAAAVAEALWLRYEQAIQQVGYLSQLVDQLREENKRLTGFLDRPTRGQSVRDMAEDMLDDFDDPL